MIIFFLDFLAVFIFSGTFIERLDEKEQQDICKFGHRDILGSTQEGETVLGTTCWQHSRGTGRRNGARGRLQNSMAQEGLQLSKGADTTENKTRRFAWLPGAWEPSHCLLATAIQPWKLIPCPRNFCQTLNSCCSIPSPTTFSWI